jgi:hypothetical protein
LQEYPQNGIGIAALGYDPEENETLHLTKGVLWQGK